MFMDAALNQRIRYEIILLNRARKEYVSRLEFLKDSKGCILKRKKPGNSRRFYYSIKRPGSETYAYLGSSNHHTVRQVSEMHYLEEAIRRIDRNIELCKSLADGFLPYDPGSVNESLPATYRCEVPPASEFYAAEAAKWKSDRLEFQKRFPENYPQRKRHHTSDGVKVKTVSELTMYEMFRAAGLVQIYELPLVLKDYGPPLYPDLTVLSPVDLKSEIIVEFVGRLDLREYREDFAKKIGRYISNGYIVGVNLFFIYADRDGNVDSAQIAAVIADILGIRSNTSI